MVTIGEVWKGKDEKRVWGWEGGGGFGNGERREGVI